MKIIEIAGGINVTLSNEENVLLDKIKEKEKIFKNTLSEREKEIARILVNKGVIKRFKDNKKIFFIYNKLEKVWRI